MAPWLVRALLGLACLGWLLFAQPAQANEKVEQLAKQLRSGDDFRVRTQAALALGASKTHLAVRPLCDGLGDTNTSVRAAAAAALGKLRKGGLRCLKARVSREKTASVKKQLTASAKRVEKALGPVISASTAYYVVLELSNGTEASNTVVETQVKNGLLKVFKKKKGFVLASPEDTIDDDKKLLAQYSQASGFLLQGKATLTHTGGVMKVKLAVSVFDYPNRALKGGYSVTVGFPDIEVGDSAARKELLAEAGRSAAEKFRDNAEQFNK